MTYILQPYDDTLRTILNIGVRKPNRTGTDAITVFGMQARYRIDERFPILTRRKLRPKAIFAELLWMLSGSTNNKDLQALGSNIWTPWVDNEWSERRGYVEGALGPVYGFQLRHFNGEYHDGNGRAEAFGYGWKGFDQISYMMNELKTNPDSRRILFSMWNPNQMHQMRLPPCHYAFQLFVEGDKLSGMLTQRSCDFPVGVPANIQFYSTLIYMFAQQADLKPYEFIHSTADSHIYVDQVPAVEEYLARSPLPSPKLRLNKAKDIFSYTMDDIVIEEYEAHPPIKIPVAV